MFSLLQSLSTMPGLLPIRKELIDLLQHSCELEAAIVEHNLAATLISLQLGRHEASIERLLQHTAQLMEVIELQQEVMKERSVLVPTDLAQKCSELSVRQESLAAQVAAEKQLPAIVSRGMQVLVTIVPEWNNCKRCISSLLYSLQLPTIARLSARLYTTMTGVFMH